MRLERSDLEVEVLVNRIYRLELDLQPDYQRGDVWDRRRQQRLIDTMLRSWYIPPIHVVRDQFKGPDYVLDGQQRLRAIVNFLSNEFPIDGLIEPGRSDIRALDGLVYDQLPKEVQRRIRTFPVAVVTLSEFEPAEPAELFFRLNQQYALTPSEKRNALFGPARDQIKSLTNELILQEYFAKETIGFANGRLAYDDVLSRVCFTIERKSLVSRVTNQDIEQFYRTSIFAQRTVDAARSAAESLGTALRSIGGARLNKATLFSWLIFTHTLLAEVGWQFPADFIRRFELFRGTKSLSLFEIEGMSVLRPVLDAYNDRASYRVFDVTSVLVRDVALHVAHAVLIKPVGRELEISGHIQNIVGDLDPADFLLNLAEFSPGWTNVP